MENGGSGMNFLLFVSTVKLVSYKGVYKRSL